MNHHTRVKICGITSLQDAETAVTHGADAIGLVFYPKSVRYISIERAAAIAEAIGPFVSVVALFVNATNNEIKRVVERVPLHYLQFHGDESAATCEQFGVPYLKAVKVPSPTSQSEAAISAVQQQVIHDAQAHPRAKAILLDTLHPQQHGGTGQKFDWRCVPNSAHFRWVLAGGLNADNVAEATAQVLPYAVDVSSGVESKPGVKDSAKVKTFIQNANLKTYERN
jgi:phosphoribosylanthranilate isomerase